MKFVKTAIISVLLVATVLLAASCGKKCASCGDLSMSGEEMFGEFVCKDCIDDMNDLFGDLGGLLG